MPLEITLGKTQMACTWQSLVFGEVVESSESTGLQRVITGGYGGRIKPEAQLALHELTWLSYRMARAVLLTPRIQLR